MRFKTRRISPDQSCRGTASSPGTCGELVQGRFPGGEDFLVTFPVNLWSRVQVEPVFTSPKIQCDPAGKRKTQKAVRKVLDYLGFPEYGATIRVQSDIPEGKGMASSTADITAACCAAAASLGVTLTPDEISRIAIAIEPCDGLMYPGVVCYNHCKGTLIESLGALPPTDILIVDPGGGIDTLSFNRIPKGYSEEELATLQDAYDLVRMGIIQKDRDKIGMGAVKSARVNQRLLPKPELEKLIGIAERSGASGVCTAHSGTITGLLYKPGRMETFSKTIELIRDKINRPLKIYILRSL